ncbi:MAG: AbrB family transcriptional regulator [Eubacteriales bacterium]|nr:AbrB family transcriptional regulator [Clostridiales bacterium]MDY5835883.1 AbrB family transcriptional regulator [Eubacteriales bacterium]
MKKTRTRKQGSSIVVTLPGAEEVKLKSGKDYMVTYTQNGSIIMVPEITDPFRVAEPDAFYEADYWQDVPAAGKEEI